MRQYRKIAVAVLLVFAAIITPPDVVSQVLIFFPCYALYEYGIRIAAKIEAQKAKEEAEYQARMQQEQAAIQEEAEMTEEVAAEEVTEESSDDKQ
jgi:Sec-independent protein secretion pathway component TatC